MNAHDDDTQQSGGELTTERLVEILQHGTFESEYGVMRWSSNYTFLLSVLHDDVQVMAVYKPQKGERPLWDFPDGTLCYREVAAFETSRQLGWDIVPPTVLREGPHGLGSVQLYIDHDPEVNYFAFTEEIRPQLQRLSIFDHLINNADRKGGHCLIDGSGHLWGIDHGIAFNSDHKLRTVIWDFAGQPIPPELTQSIEILCGELDNPKSGYRSQLDTLLSPPEITAFQHRVRQILQTGRYPQPGRGPNYPWPPV